MSFLDSLENNLKALEGQDAGGLDDSKRRMSDKQRALATAPWAEKLRNGDYVKALMRDLTRAGFERRTKINFAWLGTTLRVEAVGERMELTPAPDGVGASLDGRRVMVDVDGSPEKLMKAWLELLDKKRAELRAMPVDVFDDEDTKALG